MSPHRARGRFAPYVLGTALLALAAVLAAFAVGAFAASEAPGGADGTIGRSDVSVTTSETCSRRAASRSREVNSVSNQQ